MEVRPLTDAPTQQFNRQIQLTSNIQHPGETHLGEISGKALTCINGPMSKIVWL